MKKNAIVFFSFQIVLVFYIILISMYFKFMLNLCHVNYKTKKDVLTLSILMKAIILIVYLKYFYSLSANYNLQLNCSRNFILPVIIHAETRFLELFFVDFSQT